MEVNYQQISYMTLIGMHSTMHLVHPNLCHVTTMCVCVCVYLSSQLVICS